jgi:hypothetical protein
MPGFNVKITRLKNTDFIWIPQGFLEDDIAWAKSNQDKVSNLE